MSNENDAGLRPSQVGSDARAGGGYDSDARRAELAARYQMERKAAQEAAVEASFRQSLRDSVPAAFAENDTWVGLRRKRDASDTNIQPDECWRIRRPTGRF